MMALGLRKKSIVFHKTQKLINNVKAPNNSDTCPGSIPIPGMVINLKLTLMTAQATANQKLQMIAVKITITSLKSKRKKSVVNHGISTINNKYPIAENMLAKHIL